MGVMFERVGDLIHSRYSEYSADYCKWSVQYVHTQSIAQHSTILYCTVLYASGNQLTKLYCTIRIRESAYQYCVCIKLTYAWMVT